MIFHRVFFGPLERLIEFWLKSTLEISLWLAPGSQIIAGKQWIFFLYERSCRKDAIACIRAEADTSTSALGQTNLANEENKILYGSNRAKKKGTGASLEYSHRATGELGVMPSHARKWRKRSPITAILSTYSNDSNFHETPLHFWGVSHAWWDGEQKTVGELVDERIVADASSNHRHVGDYHAVTNPFYLRFNA